MESGERVMYGWSYWSFTLLTVVNSVLAFLNWRRIPSGTYLDLAAWLALLIGAWFGFHRVEGNLSKIEANVDRRSIKRVHDAALGIAFIATIAALNLAFAIRQ